MSLQIRRGPNQGAGGRTGVTPAQGEIVYVTDFASQNVSPMWIGDGTTLGGNPVAPVLTVNGLTGQVSLTTDTLGEGSHNLYFTTTRSIDAVGTALAAGTLSGVAISYNNTTHTISITNTNVIQSGTTNSLAYWAANGTTLSPSSNLTWNESTNVLQNINGTLYVTANNGNRATVIYDNYNVTGANALTFRRAHGTNVTPTGVAANDNIHNIAWQAHDGTNFVNTSFITGTVAYGSVVASGNVQGSLIFGTTDITQTSAVLYNRVRIDNAGNVTIGPYITTESGSGQLVVRQTVSSNGKSPATIYNIYGDPYGATFGLAKARGTFATPAAVIQNDVLGAVNFRGYTGSGYVNAASVRGYADAAPVSGSNGYLPGYLSFLVTSSTGLLNEAMRISSDSSAAYNGNFVVNGTLTVNGSTVTTNSTTINVEDKLMKLGYLTNSTVSTVGTVGSISGTGPWTATISGMSDNIDLQVGSTITATGTGTTGTITLSATTHSTASCTSGNISGTTFTVGGTVSGVFAIGMAISGAGITPGTYIVSGSGSVWTLNVSDTVGASLVTGTLNTITVSSTSALQIGTIITTPSAIGGLATSTNYYVDNIVSATQFSVSTTIGGTTDVTLTTASGSVSLTYANGSLGTGGTYVVASIPTATSITFTATGGTTPVAGPVTAIATSGANDNTANGGGIQVYGTSNKTFTWNSGTTAWTSSENISVATGKVYEVNGVSVLSATALGSSVVGSSLTSVGTLTNLTVATSGVITGDFDNATFANRTVFRTATTNASTGIYAVPNGTNTAASWQALNSSTPTNASKILIATNGSTDVQLVSGINGTGTYLPMTFWNSGSGQVKLDTAGNFTVYGAGALGYSTGSGGAVTQGSSRTTGVTLNKSNGAITLFTAAGSATPTTFTVTNSSVAATDIITVNVKSSTNVYLVFVTAVAAGSFNITFYTTGGVVSDAPVFTFAVIKAVTA